MRPLILYCVPVRKNLVFALQSLKYKCFFISQLLLTWHCFSIKFKIIKVTQLKQALLVVEFQISVEKKLNFE